MPFTGRQFEELYDELDKNKTGVIKYNIFLAAGISSINPENNSPLFF